MKSTFNIIIFFFILQLLIRTNNCIRMYDEEDNYIATPEMVEMPLIDDYDVDPSNIVPWSNQVPVQVPMPVITNQYPYDPYRYPRYNHYNNFNWNNWNRPLYGLGRQYPSLMSNQPVQSDVNYYDNLINKFGTILTFPLRKTRHMGRTGYLDSTHYPYVYYDKPIWTGYEVRNPLHRKWPF